MDQMKKSNGKVSHIHHSIPNTFFEHANNNILQEITNPEDPRYSSQEVIDSMGSNFQIALRRDHINLFVCL